MVQNNDELRARLLAENDEFKKLHDEHRGCDERLHEFSRKAFLSGDEQIEEAPHLGAGPAAGPAMQCNYGKTIRVATFLPVDLMQRADGQPSGLARFQ